MLGDANAETVVMTTAMNHRGGYKESDADHYC